MASEQADKTGQETHRHGWLVGGGECRECGWGSRPVVIWWWEVVQVYSCPVLNACSEGLVLASIENTDLRLLSQEKSINSRLFLRNPE